MIKDQSYEMIFKRKSIRKYKAEKLPMETLNEIEEYISDIAPLYTGIKVDIKIVDASYVKNLLPIKSPHYLIISSEKKPGYLVNAGYMVQKIDLFLASNGIGGCYVGMAKPTRELGELLNHEFVIAYAFGNPEETLYRDSIHKFKRKSIDEIYRGGVKTEILEAARVAPSATNSQPWYFTFGDDKIHVYRIRQNILKSLIYDKMNQLDMGIAICHIFEAIQKEGSDYEIFKSEEAEVVDLKGYFYIMSIAINAND